MFDFGIFVYLLESLQYRCRQETWKDKKGYKKTPYADLHQGPCGYMVFFITTRPR